MKKLLVMGLALVFSAAVSNMAFADGTGTACAGKKCKGHHSHKKDSKINNSSTTNGAAAPAK